MSAMDQPIEVAVEVPWVGDQRLKTWAKVVTNVDETLATGWAFEGEFVAVGGIQDVPAGAVLLVYGEKGSRANPNPLARVYRVNADATLTLTASCDGRAWARTLRDEVVEMLATEPIPLDLDWDPTLMRYSVAALEEELRRRGK